MQFVVGKVGEALAAGDRASPAIGGSLGSDGVLRRDQQVVEATSVTAIVIFGGVSGGCWHSPGNSVKAVWRQ